MDVTIVMQALIGASFVPIALEGGVVEFGETSSADRAEIRAATKRPLPIQIAKKALKIYGLADEITQRLPQVSAGRAKPNSKPQRSVLAAPGPSVAPSASAEPILAIVPFVETVSRRGKAALPSRGQPFEN